MGQMGQFLDGSYEWWVDALSPMTHLHTRLSLCHVKLPLMFVIHFIGGNSTNNLILYCLIAQEELLVIPVSSVECERHFSAFNARHIITSQRNLLFPETVEALSIVLEGYKKIAAVNCHGRTSFLTHL